MEPHQTPKKSIHSESSHPLHFATTTCQCHRFCAPTHNSPSSTPHVHPHTHTCPHTPNSSSGANCNYTSTCSCTHRTTCHPHTCSCSHNHHHCCTSPHFNCAPPPSCYGTHNQHQHQVLSPSCPVALQSPPTICNFPADSGTVLDALADGLMLLKMSRSALHNEGFRSQTAASGLPQTPNPHVSEEAPITPTCNRRAFLSDSTQTSPLPTSRSHPQSPKQQQTHAEQQIASAAAAASSKTATPRSHNTTPRVQLSVQQSTPRSPHSQNATPRSRSQTGTPRSSRQHMTPMQEDPPDGDPSSPREISQVDDEEDPHTNSNSNEQDLEVISAEDDFEPVSGDEDNDTPNIPSDNADDGT
ncbi:hypothetical protein Pelo_13801 [Pelomyxa schiedti]|nr:hypothetical protein Pelo_13801 [Pelomyxa schiedti]